MVKKVIYLEIAVRDLKAIYDYISRDSIKYAKLEIKKIKTFAETLKYQPFKGKFFQFIKGKEIRSVIFRHYSIYYLYENEQISILTIHYHSRLLANNPALIDEL